MYIKENSGDVLSLALPAVGEMILYMMIWVFDTMMVGQYGGSIAVSTVGLSSQILYTFMNVFISYGLAIGVASLVSRKYGARLLDTAEEYATTGVAVGTIISLLITMFIFIFCRGILTITGAKENVIASGVMFMRIASLGMFFGMLTSILNSTLRGYGNTKTPLYASILINIVNLGLDWLLIFGHYGFPELGIKGSAIATTTAQIIGFLFISFYSMQKSKIKPRLKYLLHLKLEKVKELIFLSIPASLQEGSLDLSRLFTSFIIMHLGTVAFAANQIATTIESVSFMPGAGFGIAATTLTGNKIGEENIKKAREYAYTSMIFGIIIMCFCAALFLLCPNFLIKLFINSKEKEVIYLGSLCIMVAAIEQPAMAVSMVLGGSLKGTGDTKTPFLISLISSWGIRIPLMLILIYVYKLSVVFVWFITAIQWTFEAVIISIFFKKRLNKFDKALLTKK